MFDVQTISVVIAAGTVVIEVINSIYTSLREKRNQQIQFFQQIWEDWTRAEYHKQYMTFMNLEWEDYDDFYRKYWTINNPDAYGLVLGLWEQFSGIGLMVREGVIDADIVHDYGGYGIV